MYLECEWCGKTFYRRKNDKRNIHIYCSQDCITARDISAYKIRFLSENKHFKIIHYENKKNVTIACRSCGDIATLDNSNAIKRTECFNCIRLKNEEIKAEKSRQLKLQEQFRQLAKLEAKLNKAYNKRLEVEKRKEQTKENIRAERKRAELKRESRIKNNGKVDKDISLKRLYNRDHGICYICGEKCDYSDHTITKEGYFIAGKKYPSIDHVKQLSKGGTHTWDNVKLAHMICNSRKG